MVLGLLVGVMTERDAILASSPPSAETVHLSAPGPHQSVVQCLPKEIRNLLAGGVAGMVAKSVVAPIDRIKILYQVTSAHFRIRDVPRVAAEIVRTEGVAALWKGKSGRVGKRCGRVGGSRLAESSSPGENGCEW